MTIGPESALLRLDPVHMQMAVVHLARERARVSREGKEIREQATAVPRKGMRVGKEMARARSRAKRSQKH